MMGGSKARLWPQMLLALLATIAVTVFQIARQPPQPIEADSLGYTIIAHDLARYGIMGDGSNAPKPQQPPRPGMFVPPLYTSFLAGMIRLDPVLARTTECHVARWWGAKELACGLDLGIALPIQGGLAVLAALLVWGAGLRLTGSLPCAWGALALALVTGRYASYAGTLLTENLALPLFTLAVWALVEAAAARRAAWMSAAGLCFGLLVLARPGFAYVFYAAVPVLVWVWRRQPPAAILTRLGLLAAGYGLVVGSWALRNWTQLDAFAVTGGYDSFILVQRLAYNSMTLREGLAAMLYWLPGPGEALAIKLYPPELLQRLGFEHPQSFFAIGNGVWREQLFAAAGGKEHATGYLVREILLPDLPKHLLVTLLLAWRGVWIVKFWTLLTVPAGLAGLGLAAAARQWRLLAFAVPAWFMLGFHAFATVNVHRYNLILIPSLSIATAWLGWRMVTHWRGKRLPS